jgi:6-pyruvoyltetrahydropterin/6-carboxytetrahydropterin synthase
MSIYADRYHDISCGHRVYGHESKCALAHGHNYRIHFTVQAVPLTPEVDTVGRVLDFSDIKARLCMWLEENWDHRFLLWEKDPWVDMFQNQAGETGLVVVPFNPTAENMAAHLVKEVAPIQLHGTNCFLVACRIEETRKCAATYTWEG